MTRIIIICEGQTEHEFCEKTLQPYFNNKNTYIQTPLIKKSKGGIVVWKHLKKEIESHLKEDANAYVSTFIDYYGISDKHEFPHWEEAKKIVDKHDRTSRIEQAMQLDISEDIRFRFIPYIQLHEFEALLFSEKDVFDKRYNDEEVSNREELDNIFNTFDNPEDINNNKETTPSKRLERIIARYNKVIDGVAIANNIGLDRIMSKNPRFKKWVEKLSNVAE